MHEKKILLRQYSWLNFILKDEHKQQKRKNNSGKYLGLHVTSRGHVCRYHWVCLSVFGLTNE